MPFQQMRPNFSRGIGPGDYTVRSVTATATLLESDDVLLCNGTFTVTLPSASTHKHKRFDVKNIGTGTITVSGGSSDIDGSSSRTLTTQYESMAVISDGSDWWRI